MADAVVVLLVACSLDSAAVQSTVDVSELVKLGCVLEKSEASWAISQFLSSAL